MQVQVANEQKGDQAMEDDPFPATPPKGKPNMLLRKRDRSPIPQQQPKQN